MKKIILLIPILACLIISCQKVTQRDKETYIAGRVFLYDSLNPEKSKTPLSKIEIKLSDVNPEINSNYLYSLKSDTDGYYTFNLLQNQKEVYISAEYALNNVKYFGFSKIEPSEFQNAELILNFNSSIQNALVLYAVDSLGGTIQNCTINLFKSQVLAENEDEKGIIKQATSDEYGKVVFTGLAPDTYFVNAKGIFANNLTLENKLTKLVISKTGIVKTELVLKKP